MSTFDILFQDENGYLTIKQMDVRPLAEPLDGEVFVDGKRQRKIELPKEQTGATTDPETGDPVPVITTVPVKYCRLVAGQLEAMEQDERDARDAFDKAQYEASPAGIRHAEITELLQRLAVLLVSFDIALPVNPMAAMMSIKEQVATDEDRDKVQEIQFLLTTLKIDYGLTNEEIGGIK